MIAFNYQIMQQSDLCTSDHSVVHDNIVTTGQSVVIKFLQRLLLTASALFLHFCLSKLCISITVI